MKWHILGRRGGRWWRRGWYTHCKKANSWKTWQKKEVHWWRRGWRRITSKEEKGWLRQISAKANAQTHGCHHYVWGSGMYFTIIWIYQLGMKNTFFMATGDPNFHTFHSRKMNFIWLIKFFKFRMGEFWVIPLWSCLQGGNYRTIMI